MKHFSDFSDQRLKSSCCIQCGGRNGSHDHVPSKNLLLRPLPDNLPVVETCASCNNNFAADEEYLFLFLNCVLGGSTNPARHDDARVARALQHHKKLRVRIENSKTIDDARCVWMPEIERIKRIVVKNARGHAFYEYGERLLTAPEHVWVTPLETMTPEEREEFENCSNAGHLAGWPGVGSRMMIRLVEDHDLHNGWIVVQEGVYRYRVEQCGVMLTRSILFEYLATEVYWCDD